ncbi:MAG: DUF302 domain-containing protein [Bacteroidota bacterium]
MNYYYNVIIKDKSFKEVYDAVKERLTKEGFGIPTEVNLKDVFKMKLDVDFKNYVILGACNPSSALKAVQSEKNIGVLLPCSVVVQEHENGHVEVAAVDPIASMMAVKNNTVQSIAIEIARKLESVVEDLRLS